MIHLELMHMHYQILGIFVVFSLVGIQIILDLAVDLWSSRLGGEIVL